MTRLLRFILGALALVALPAQAAGGGLEFTLIWGLPFAGLLLSICALLLACGLYLAPLPIGKLRRWGFAAGIPLVALLLLQLVALLQESSKPFTFRMTKENPLPSVAGYQELSKLKSRNACPNVPRKSTSRSQHSLPT